MKPNVRPSDRAPGAFEVLDFTLFMYGLVRGDVVQVGTGAKSMYEGLAVWELDGAYRLGIPYVERSGWLTRLSGLVTASKVEFSVPPDRKEDLVCVGPVVSVIESAFRGKRDGFTR